MRAARPRRLRLLVNAAAVTAGFALVCALVAAAVVQPWVEPIPSRQSRVDRTRIASHLRVLSEQLHPRSYDDAENLERAANYIAREFEAAGGRVESQPVAVGGLRYRNVIARFGPANGPLKVVGAHYDACRISDGDPAATPGADDNASGVAALLELARALQRRPPDGPVELVAYTLEEPPFFAGPDMGSARHARRLRTRGNEVALMLSLETVGYFSDRPGSQRYPLPGMAEVYGDRGDFIALVGRFGDFASMRRAKALMAGASPLPVRSVNAPAIVPGVDFSDHRNYWAEDFPALMVTDTAFYRNPHYHRPTDTLQRLDLDRLAQVVRGVEAIVRSY